MIKIITYKKKIKNFFLFKKDTKKKTKPTPDLKDLKRFKRFKRFKSRANPPRPLSGKKSQT